MIYYVTVDINATKTYKIDSPQPEIEFRSWVENNLERLDSITNPIGEYEYLSIKEIEVMIPSMSKAEVYAKLAQYLEELTSNDEPLELLKILKPEE